ncbi:MAG: M20/M25/M40 family metallo-hydrolase [Pirellulales bacterium]|nr:M20/M25/M40 family metallo-hydrolase [Pirellulales bacterium]
MRSSISVAASLAALALSGIAGYAEESAHRAAFHSITSSELYHHVEVLADDAMEGRLAGSQGGQAAAQYIVDKLAQIGIQPAGLRDTYFQQFSANYSNILCELHGSDPVLADDRIIVSAHYDHVGYGTLRTSYGPIGMIHNGADDNASGVATMLELIEALVQYGQPLRRSILFAFWDGEEQGLLGSRHWMNHPTIPIANIRLAINLDMVGRLRNGQLIIGGTRTGYGLRRLVSSREIGPSLWLDFDWNLRANSDHWSYVERNIPTIFLFTGLHDNYHRPSDDTEYINAEGMQDTTRYLLDLVQRAADRDTLPAYRPTGRIESQYTRQRREIPLPELQPRLGVAYQESFPAEDATENWEADLTDPADQAVPGSVRITEVRDGTPAEAAGLAVGDEILAIGDETLQAEGDFMQLLLKSPSATTLMVRRAGGHETEPVHVTLAGKPIRIGIAWRADDAEPDTVCLTRVVPGSPAARAGLGVFDRICAVNEESFTGLDGFNKRISSALTDSNGTIQLLVETRGQLHDVIVEL